MKVKSILLFMSILASLNQIMAQDYVRLKNHWKGNESIHIENGKIESGEIKAGAWSAEWEMVKTGQYYRIKNRWKPNQFIHIENGKIECGEIKAGAWSSEWEMIVVGQYYRIKNRWKPNQFIHIENGKIECGEIKAGAWSAEWEMIKQGVTTTPTPTPMVTVTIENPHVIVVVSNDGSTDPAIYGKAYLRLKKNNAAIREWVLLNRTDADGQRIIAPQGRAIGLELQGGNSVTVPSSELKEYSLELDVSLWDYDWGADPDEHLGAKKAQVLLSDLNQTKQETFVTLTGEGNVKVAFTAYSDSKNKVISTDGFNWMSSIDDDVKLFSLSIPGTHDSGADYGSGDAVSSPYAKCQDASIFNQLAAGIRYLDIRCRRSGNGFTIHHGPYYQHKNFDDVLVACEKFLKESPFETILMRIKEEHSLAEGSGTFRSIFITYENKYSIIDKRAWHSSPLMRDVRGKIVIINEAGLQSGIVYNGTNTLVSDKYHFTNTKDKWPIVETALAQVKTNAGNKLGITYCSANGVNADADKLVASLFGAVPTPKDFAVDVLPKLSNFIDKNQKGKLGVVAMDFPTPDVIKKIISSNDSQLLRK